MLQSRVIVIALLLILIQDVKGIGESSGDQDHSSVGSGNGQSILTIDLRSYCGLFTNFSDCALDHQLGNLTSNGLINITADVLLLSIVPLVALENVSIIGHNNPTITCDNSGGMYLDSCHNCTIKGITWEKCGNKTDSKPVIELYNSSNIIIQNCSFLLSQSQVIVLSEMSGNVSINSCKFVFNNYVEGNGTIIHYLSKIKYHFSALQLIMISDCNFTRNEASIDATIIYIGPSSNKSMEQIYFTNNSFFSNQGTPIYISYQKVIISGFMIFEENKVSSGGGMSITNYSSITFQKLKIKFINNTALDRGGALHIQNSNIALNATTAIIFDGNKARLGGALFIWEYSMVTLEGNSIVKISNNQADRYGGAFHITYNSDVTFEEDSTVTISNNQAETLGGAFYIARNSDVTFEKDSTVTISNNQADRYGGAFHITYNSDVTFEEDSTVIISNNQAETLGGAFYIARNSDVTFEKDSTVTISNNQAIVAGAILVLYYSNVTFEGNSTVKICNNQANLFGGAIHILHHSDVTFKGDSTVTISNNQAEAYGGALYVYDFSNLTFEGNSTVTISNNQADYYDGGALYIEDYSDVTFEGNSTVTISNNQADDYGGALFVRDNSDVTFEGDSTVTISNNQADNGGALYIRNNSDVTIKGNSSVKFDNNAANNNGGALYLIQDSNASFEEDSCVMFYNNTASVFGGVLCALNNCNVTIKGNSLVKFDNNVANNSGGALYLMQDSNVSFEEDSCVMFCNNTASVVGGVLCALESCNVTIKGNSNATFNNNQALGDGGALYAISNSVILFQARSTVQFNDNKALSLGGALYSRYGYDITFENDCTVTFSHNEASQGGAIFIPFNTMIVFTENSSVQFHDNKATLGGALHVSRITFKENTTVIFENNEAITNGGAIFSDNSKVIVKQNSTIIFTSNNAENGGAVFASFSTLLVSEYSNLDFYKNIAGQNGGAIYFNDQIYASFSNSSAVTMTSNFANNHGGAIYNKITQNTKYFNISEISCLSNNTAGVAGNLLYLDVPKSCNNSCLTNRIVGVSNPTLFQGTLDKNISSSPKILEFNETAKCISSKSAQCEKYYINNIMLGQEILIYPCLLDHYNNPAEVTQFRIIGENNHNYSVHGSEYRKISCNNAIEGIRIIGNKTITDLPLNYSMYFISHTTVREVITTNLTVELSPCHPGFRHQSKSQRCECYNSSRIVSCSGSSSTIARGYWFGHVTNIPTITICPINYCNFGCCRTTNGYYRLSPERANQCKSHRSGTACGSCEDGYTLSYASADCISINKCSTILIILVVTLTVLYWFVIVAAIFIITYYQVGIGYFYVLTYYYSVIDIILSQHTDLSDGLYITVTIMSSIAKISPQFLGQLCLFKNMSGIDQQFIHYIHPLAVSVILIIISWLARHSKRLSMFISRGIIHAICFLLLLSYTSVATVSLLLMRPLTFVDVDNLYTYLSPDVQYFQGRHLVYGITAIILALLIVIGLPLLLLTEQFLNRKISYFRIKPLLDQFQGCYKDKYRWFAGYYMICRLITIIIIIANFSGVYISRYLLLTASTIIASVHGTIRPYNDDTLNIFDGAILQLIVLVTALPLFETFDSSLVKGTSFVLVILPLVQFVVMKIHTNKQTLINVTKNAFICIQDEDVPDNNVFNDAANNDIDLVIDDSMRRNATIATISER